MSDLKSVMYETAQDLHRAGGLSTATLREIESLCLPEVKEYSAQEIKRIRAKANASQCVFARYLNISTSTVQKWETGAEKARWSFAQAVEYHRPAWVASDLLKRFQKRKEHRLLFLQLLPAGD